MKPVRLFLSSVTKEFPGYRETLRREIKDRRVDIHIQEDFAPSGTVTLAMLDEYIRDSDIVFHLAGDTTGALAKPESLRWITQHRPKFVERFPMLAATLETGELSYTQWEAYLAIFHGKRLFIALPGPNAPRETKLGDDAQIQSQRDHLRRLQALEYYGRPFDSITGLANAMLKALLHHISTPDVPTLSELQINRLLALLDREDAIGHIVDEPKGAVQVVHGTHDCLADDLLQRLKEIELPWLTRADGGSELGRLSQSEWRAHVVRGGEPDLWARHPISWPLIGSAAAGADPAELAQAGHRRFVRTLLDKVSHGTVQPDAELAGWFKHLRGQRDRHLVSSALDDRCEHAAASAELIRMLARTFQGAPADRLRVIIYLRRAHTRPAFGWLAHESIVEQLANEPGAALIALGEVQRDQLVEWAGLSENVAEVAANMVMEEVDQVYRSCGGRGFGLRLFARNVLPMLPMKTVRQELKVRVGRWPAKAGR